MMAGFYEEWEEGLGEPDQTFRILIYVTSILDLLFKMVTLSPGLKFWPFLPDSNYEWEKVSYKTIDKRGITVAILLTDHIFK